MPYPQVTGDGNLTADPELRFTGNAKAVVNVTVASTKRRRVEGEWEDEGTTFLRLNVWGDEAERLAEWAYKGCPVLYSGDLVCRKYEGREGEQRESWEVQFARVSPDPRKLDIQVRKGERRNQDQGGGGYSGGGYAGGGQRASGGQRQQSQRQEGYQDGSGWGRTARGGGGGGQGRQTAMDDPWAAPLPRERQGGGGDPWASAPGGAGSNQANGYDDEPPF